MFGVAATSDATVASLGFRSQHGSEGRAVSTESKSRKSRKPKAEVVPPEPVRAEVAPATAAAPRVSLLDFANMRLGYAEMREAKAVAEQHRMARLYALSKIDPKGLILGLEAKRDGALKDAEKAENRALIAKKRIEATIGRSLEGVGIDPETGEVRFPDQE